MKRASIALLALVLTAPAIAGEGWNYREQKDDMGRGSYKFAEIQSSNKVSFEFPYHGIQRAELTVRKGHKGTDILLDISRSHFLCNSYNGCNVMVRFDDKKAERYSAIGPADHSTNTLFIRNEAAFVRNLKQAKKVRIEAMFYKEGNRALEFDVAGLQWDDSAERAKDHYTEVVRQCRQPSNPSFLECGPRLADCQRKAPKDAKALQACLQQG
jgi:hypothetical protein